GRKPQAGRAERHRERLGNRLRCRIRAVSAAPRVASESRARKGRDYRCGAGQWIDAVHVVVETEAVQLASGVDQAEKARSGETDQVGGACAGVDRVQVAAVAGHVHGPMVIEGEITVGKHGCVRGSHGADRRLRTARRIDLDEVRTVISVEYSAG